MVVGIVAHEGGQYSHYGLMLSRSLVIIQDARPEIGDAPLTLTLETYEHSLGAQSFCMTVITSFLTFNKFLLCTLAKNSSVRAEWLCQSGRAPSAPSETPRWRITLHAASIQCVGLHIALG